MVRSYALFTDADELRTRLERRPPDAFKDFEICDRLNHDVLRHLRVTERLVDTTGSNPEATAQIMLQALDGG